jgi:hypothetical protein
MNISVAVLLLAASIEAFAPATAAGGRHGSTSSTLPKKMSGMSSDVGIPCEDECALESFPNLPESVHPGVLSGQAMMDLLNHAKENGTFSVIVPPALMFSTGSLYDAVEFGLVILQLIIVLILPPWMN